MVISISDKVDACDRSGIWIESTIINISHQVNQFGDKVVEANIGFRSYLPDADSEYQKYQGFSPKYDEIMNVTSPRL